MSVRRRPFGPLRYGDACRSRTLLKATYKRPADDFAGWLDGRTPKTCVSVLCTGVVIKCLPCPPISKRIEEG